MGNPVFGVSWEALVIENCIENMPEWTPGFYRTATGNEIDLILVRGNRKIAIECKASAAPQLTKGNYNALADINPDHTFIIAPVKGSAYQLNNGILVAGIEEAINRLKNI